MKRLLACMCGLALSAAAFGQTWNETTDGGGDAGELLGAAQSIPGGSFTLSTITGSYTTGDSDVYEITICDPANFSATTVGGATIDTQLWLFHLDGRGIVFNDDSTGLQSTLTSTFTSSLPAGRYLLAISGYDRDPNDASNQALWLDTPFAVERAPDGPGAANPYSSWAGTSTAGAYSIFLTGTCMGTPAPRGACCVAGVCSVRTEADCQTAGGTYSGDGTDCGATGACCVGGNCVILSQVACECQGGSFQGAGTNCGSATYTITNGGGGAFEDISSTGFASTAGNCDDCTQAGIPIGFNFTFFENTYTTCNISSNGNIQFGSSNSAVFTNTAIPNTAVPNDAIYPMWDDLNPGVAGDVYYQTLGTSPNQRFIVQWNNCTQFALTTSETFQVVIFEGSNDIEFRYAVITPETPAGDYTVGIENSTGTVAYSVPGSSIGSDGNVVVDYVPGSNPCEPSCFYTDCSWSTDCCPFDFNGSGGTPDDADVTTFFAAWNAGDHCADVNLSEGTPDDADISTFFAGWNAGGC